MALATTVGGSLPLPPAATKRPATDGARVNHSLLGQVGDALRDLVGGGSGHSQDDQISAGLAKDEHPRPGRAWPEPKRVKELTAQRSANARVFQLSDGRRQLELSMAPVNYRDSRGAFQPIDTRVRSTGRKGYVQGNTTNSFTSLFGDSSDRLVRFERDGRAIELGLAGDARSVTPQVSGATVTYAGMAGGARLVYEVAPTALKEKIVLDKPPSGPVSYTFALNTTGLTAEQRPDGSIAFTRLSGGQPEFVVPAPFMYDGKDDASSPHGKVSSDQVTQTLSRSSAGTTVTITPSAAWLADKSRVYPVAIDPTIKFQPVPVDAQDVSIYSGSTNTNFNDTYQMKVGTDASQAWRALVKFDLSSIPANTPIDDAQLAMYYDQTQYAWEYDVAMEARRVTAPWTESTATWANMNANMAAQPAGNSVQVDDGDTGTSVVGSWPYSTNATLTPLAINGDYRVNSDAATGDTHTWVPTITESGDYQVEVHFVSETDRATNAPYTVFYNGGSKAYTVDQTTQPGKGIWKTLGVHPFVAGTTGKVVLGDVSGKAAIADAVRFTRWGVATKKRAVSSAWSTFPVRNVVQDWVNGTPNYGFAVKAVDEATKGRGGPIFEASEYAYMNDRRDYNLPKLTVTYGKPGVAVNPPTTVTSTGALLDWPAYQGSDIVEYQVHRSQYQQFAPSATTLIAPVSPSVRSYQDTTAIPTAADETDPMKRKFYYYMIAVKTADGQVIAGPTQAAMLPKAGQITRIYRTGVTDTTLSSAQPTQNVDVYDGDPYVGPGNNSSLYGDSRGVVKFPTLSGIPADAQVVDAQLRMWNTYLYPGTDTDEYVDVYQLTRGFDETTATWQRASSATAWTNPGGDYDASWSAGFNGFTNDPEWESWNVTAPVKGWVTAPATNYGFLLRMRDEVNQTARAMLLSSEGQEPLLRPTLEVTYLEQTAESTYYAASTPTLVSPAASYTVPVSVSNPTLAAWNPTDWELSYQWERANGEVLTDPNAQASTALPKSVAAGGTVELTAQVKTPPAATDGNKRTDYVIKWQLRNKLTGKWLSETTPAIQPLPQHVAVEEPTSDQLGLEQFYSYVGQNTGAGGVLMNNMYAGNTVWSYDAFSNPSRGLSTFVRLAYNSLDTSETVAGYGWSLQASSLMRLGTPLDFHPNPNPTTVTLTDGDGTSHWFTWDDATGEWKSPKGVKLYLQRQVVCDNKSQDRQAWVMTRPDRTQFFYDCDGYLSSVVDNNGNTLTFTYDERKSNNKPTKFLRYITDAAGRTTLNVDYYVKGQAYDFIDDITWTRQSATNLTNPKIIDKIAQITDISGRRLTFTYTDKGLLGELIDGAASTNGAPKVFKFAYDMTQGNKNVKLIRVTDPRGNATSLAFYSPPQDDPKFHWRTKTYTNRLGFPTQFAYTDPDGPQGNNIDTVVTDAENHAVTYRMDGFGRPFETTNAKNETTKLGWDADHNVIRLEETNGAASTWTYDAKTGYPTEIKDAQAVHDGTPGTTLSYQRQLNGYVADLTEKTSPEGRKWTFTYTAEGDLATVVDPMGNTTPTAGDYTTTYTYDDFGQLQSQKDANGNVTAYSSFDANGYPLTITDALTKSTAYTYDVRGQVLKVTDPLLKDTTQTYDTFGRPLVLKVPKKQAAGQFIITPAPEYDTNDNVTKSTSPTGAVTTASYDSGDQLAYTLDPVDVAGDPERRTTFTYDKVGNLLTTTEPNGNLTPEAGDFVTTNTFDAIYQLTDVVDAKGDKVSYVYDNVGNVVTVIDPRKNATADPADFTSKTEYDLAHRITKSIDSLGKFTTKGYDRDGMVVSTTDQLGSTTQVTLDARGLPSEFRVPYLNNGGTISYRTSRYEYDQVGNRTKVISPRGVATTDDPDDFASVTVYDALNRVAEVRTPYDRDDARYTTADVTKYTYDPAGHLASISLPPSAGSSLRNDTTFTYFDNGWTESSTDPWDIATSYDYNDLGSQSIVKVTSGGGSSSHTLTWSYYPGGDLKARTDDGVPVGKQVVLVDNDEFNNASATGTWPTATTATGKNGPNYATHAGGTGANVFTWQLNVPQAGTYEVFAKYPQVSGATTAAKYTVNYSGGSTVKTVDQTAGAGGWVSLGSFTFAEGNSSKVTLSDQATGTVVADAVKLVRDNSADVDNEKADYGYRYDANGNLVTITDNSPASARVDKYAVTYSVLNQVDKLTESKSGTVTNTTRFTYNENGSPLSTSHDRQYASFSYDSRDLVSSVTNGTSATDPNAKVTTFTYTDRGQKQHEVKGNGNTVDYTYFLDGMLKTQTERKPSTTVVADHTYDYDLNGNRLRDVAKKMNADNHSAYLNTTSDFTYDPRDRLTKVVKTGDGAGTETYDYDGNSNITQQSIKGATTTFNYNRNRLLTATTGGSTASYNYDPFGRLDTVTAAGQILERNVYDGFNHVVENRKIGSGGAMSTTKYAYDPLDRTVSKTSDAGTAKEKTTVFNYLGLTSEVLDEEVAGKVAKSYRYSPWGQRLAQVKTNADGSTENTYYGYDPHTDVEDLTDDSGNTKATYGYTAYGKNDDAQFTGIDKPDAADPTKEPYNAYRFNAKRWDQNSQSYDMGFRDYSPGLNRFLTRDSYNGALSDLRLGVDPWTSNRYAFAGGNPISGIELDGHSWDEFLDNLGGFVGGFKDGAVDTVKGLGSLGYDMFVGSSPFVSEQTRQETHERAQARGELFKHPGMLVDAILKPYKDDIAKGDDAHAAGRAVFDISSLFVGGGLTKAGRASKAGEVTNAAERVITNERPVIFKDPVKGATPAQVSQIRDYVKMCNEAYCAGALSPTGRVSTKGALRTEANEAAAAEKAANPGKYPSGVHPGHGPDTTWTGNPQPYGWIPLDASINTSLGRQALNYPIGYKPTGFWYIDDYLAEFGRLP